MNKRFLSIGECMVELSPAGDGLLKRGFAGDTLNTAWYARAAFSSDWDVDYFTALGDDALSQEMIEFLERARIGTSMIRRIPGKAPGLYMIELSNGERSFLYWRDSAAAKQLAADPHALRAAIEASDVIYFTGITLAILARADVETLFAELRRAKASGKIVVFDPNLRPRLWSSREEMCSTIAEGAQASTIVMPSYDDEAVHFGDASVAGTIERYRALGVPLVVVKNGAQGAVVASADEQTEIAAERVETIIDTTSAGDSFNGAFLAHYCRYHDAAAAAAFAAKVAAKVICEYGALVAHERLPAVPG